MGRAIGALALLFLAGCTEPVVQLPTPPGAGASDGEGTLDLGRRALSAVADAAALDPAALWQSPQAQNPDLARILEQGGTVGVAAVTEQTVPCPGGGTLTTIRDDQGPPWPSQGDSYTTVFDACVQGNTTLDGSRRFTILEMTGQPYVDVPWRTVNEVTRENFTVSGPWGSRQVSGSGRIVQESPDNVVLTQTSTGDWLTQRDQNGTPVSTTDRYRIQQTWDQAANTQRLEFDVSSQDSQWGDVRARTLTPLIGSLNGAPDSGRVEIAHSGPGGNARTTWITAQSGGAALVETDLDGDGIPDTQVQTTWFALGVERYLNIYY